MEKKEREKSTPFSVIKRCNQRHPDARAYSCQFFKKHRLRRLQNHRFVYRAAPLCSRGGALLLQRVLTDIRTTSDITNLCQSYKEGHQVSLLLADPVLPIRQQKHIVKEGVHLWGRLQQPYHGGEPHHMGGVDQELDNTVSCGAVQACTDFIHQQHPLHQQAHRCQPLVCCSLYAPGKVVMLIAVAMLQMLRCCLQFGCTVCDNAGFRLVRGPSG